MDEYSLKEEETHMEDQGIYDLIQLSRVGPRYNPHMVLVVMCFW